MRNLRVGTRAENVHGQLCHPTLTEVNVLGNSPYINHPISSEIVGDHGDMVSQPRQGEHYDKYKLVCLSGDDVEYMR